MSDQKRNLVEIRKELDRISKEISFTSGTQRIKCCAELEVLKGIIIEYYPEKQALLAICIQLMTDFCGYNLPN